MKRICECIPEVLEELGVEREIAEAMVRHPCQLSFPPESYREIKLAEEEEVA